MCGSAFCNAAKYVSDLVKMLNVCFSFNRFSVSRCLPFSVLLSCPRLFWRLCFVFPCVVSTFPFLFWCVGAGGGHEWWFEQHVCDTFFIRFFARGRPSVPAGPGGSARTNGPALFPLFFLRFSTVFIFSVVTFLSLFLPLPRFPGRENGKCHCRFFH